jgi:hypothetical protein
MIDLPFVGRTKALELLNQLLLKKTATLAVVSGRRRIGKSRLIEEFGKEHRFLQFMGIPPDRGVAAQIKGMFLLKGLAKPLVSPLYDRMIGVTFFKSWLTILGKEGLSLYLMRLVGWEWKTPHF